MRGVITSCPSRTSLIPELYDVDPEIHLPPGGHDSGTTRAPRFGPKVIDTSGPPGPPYPEVFMSATQPVSKTPSTPVGLPAPPPVVWLRRYAPPVALVVGPILMVAGMALHAEGLPDEAFVRTVQTQPGQWLTSHLLLAFGNALIALGAAAVAVRMARGRGATLTAVGAVVASVGGVLMSLGDLGHGAVAYSLVDHVAVADSLAIQEAYFSNPAIAVVSFGGMLLPLGLMVLGFGLVRSRLVPRWAAVVLLVSPILIQASMASGPQMVLFGLPLVVGMGALARGLARSS